MRLWTGCPIASLNSADAPGTCWQSSCRGESEDYCADEIVQIRGADPRTLQISTRSILIRDGGTERSEPRRNLILSSKLRGPVGMTWGDRGSGVAPPGEGGERDRCTW